MSELYNRQEKLKLDIPKKVCVVGCGGVGYWVALFLAMSGCENISLYDPDVIEESNLNRLNLSSVTIGKNKADITREMIIKIRPEAAVYAYPFKFLGMETGYNWIIDCTDKEESQIEVQKIANQSGSKYFKSGYDGEGFSIHNEVPEWGDSIDGYRIVPSWVVPAVIVAALSVAKVMKHPKLEVISTIEKIFGFYR